MVDKLKGLEKRIELRERGREKEKCGNKGRAKKGEGEKWWKDYLKR